MQLNFNINLLEDGAVVTRDGEYLGRWELDAEDHPSFTPDGHTEQLLRSPWIGLLCEEIEQWRRSKNDVG